MGVKGLWKLLDGTGRPVCLEELEGKILAVDISVWLNMAVKGMRDYHGHAMANAHLITLFSRVCKLLFYGVKPVFVFDGPPPQLKLQILRERREKKNQHVKSSEKGNEKILQNYLRKQILENAAGEKSKRTEENADNSGDAPKKPVATANSFKKEVEKDIYDLPPLGSQLQNSDDDSFEEGWNMRSQQYDEYYDKLDDIDFLSVDVDPTVFDSLPSDVQYDLLKHMKEIRKRRHTKLETMPEEANSFSSYQVAGILARQKITRKMEDVEKKISEENVATSSLLSGLADDASTSREVHASHLVSDSTSHYIWLEKRAKQDATNEGELKSHGLPASNTSTSEEKVKQRSNILVTISEEEDNSVNFHDEKAVPLLEEEKKPDRNFEVVSTLDVTDKPNSVTLDDIEVLKSEQTTPVDKTSALERTGAISISSDSISSSPDKNRDNLQHTSALESQDVKVVSESDVTRSTDEVQNLKKDEVPVILHAGKGNTAEGEALVTLDSSDEEFIDVQCASEGENLQESREGMASCEEMAAPDSCTVKVDITSQSHLREAEDGKEAESAAEAWHGLDIDDVQSFNERLDAESMELKKMVQAKERAARDLTHSASLECQELLRLFGLPYVLSPQEAEAQCAELELLGLTDGTITEDSDIFLFGGRYVIKSMFSGKTNPVGFDHKDIEMNLGLNRDQLICIAMCSGSDYTTGVRGVGPSIAMEIVKEFGGQGIDGLKDMKKWWQEARADPRISQPKEKKIRSQLRRIRLKNQFPSETVYKAYVNPIVDETKTAFEWGFPSLDDLRCFATNKMGWTRKKVDETLLPVIKKMGQRRNTQFIPVTKHHQKALKRRKRTSRTARGSANAVRKQHKANTSAVPKLSGSSSSEE